MNPVLSAMANHLWQSTVFAVAAGLLTLALRNNRARVRHAVWMAASCKFLIPISLLISLGSHLQWQSVPQVASPNLTALMDEVSLPFAISSVAQSASMPPSSPAANLALAVLFVIWAVGFIGVAGAWGVRWRSIRAAVRAGITVNLKTPIPRRSIRVITSPTLLEPGVFGIYRPVMMLPDGIFDRLTPAQLTSVIEHELCHFRHRDNLVAAIHMFVETVFWFYPLVWWIGRWMLEERERACDEEVLQILGEPRIYADALLGVCKLYLESPLVCVSGVTGSNLRKRIETIMVNRVALRLNYLKKSALAIAGTAAVVIPIAMGVLHATSVRAQTVRAPAPSAPKVKFVVASIKRCINPPVGEGEGRGPAPSDSPNRMSIPCWSLAALIRRAYIGFADGRFNGNYHPVKIERLPAWGNSDFYTIEARAEGSPGQFTMRGPMLQALLEERFALKIHTETKEEKAFALTVAKGGLKLQPFRGSCIPFDPIQPKGRREELCRGTPQDAPMSLEVFAWLLGDPKTNILDAPVIDKTGINGDFHVAMEPFFKLAHSPANASPDDPLFASVFTAIADLGLKLQAIKAPRQSLVVDHVERPSAN